MTFKIIPQSVVIQDISYGDSRTIGTIEYSDKRAMFYSSAVQGFSLQDLKKIVLEIERMEQ